MRINRASLVLLLLSLCALLQPCIAVAAAAEFDPNTQSSPDSGSPPSPPQTTSARDDDPVIKDVRTLRNAAMALMDKRAYTQSIEKLRDAISKMHARVFGADRVRVTDPKDQSMDAAYYAQLLSDYGTVLIRDKQYDEAADVLQDASAMTKKIFGESHPSFGLILRSLADAYMAKKEYRIAIRHYKTLRRHVVRGLGPTHEAYFEATLRIAEAYRHLNNLPRAISIYKKALAKQGSEVNMATKGVGELFMELATTQNLLGVDADEAAQYATTAREVFKTRDGDETIDYAFSLNALAGVEMRAGRVDAAYELLQQAHAIAVRIYGDGHKMVLASAKTIADVEQHREKLKKEKKKTEKESKGDDVKDEL